MRSYFWIIVIGLTIGSCSGNRDGNIFHNPDENKIEVGIIEDDSILLEVAYIGAIGHSYVFECYVENKSSNSLLIDKSQFSMKSLNKEARRHIDENRLIAQLEKDKKGIKRQRKSNTILGIIGVGLGTLLGTTAGLTPAQALLSSAEPIVYIFDDRRWYQRNIESVEDEIEYIRNAQFNNALLLPGESIVRDLLFPTYKIQSDVDITASVEDQDFIITFPQKIFR